MITAESLLSAVEARRIELGSAESPISYSEAARAIGVHSAIFSRLKRTLMPSPESVSKIGEWVGGEEKLHCSTCTDLAEDDPEDEIPAKGEDDPKGEEPKENGGAIVALIPASSDPIYAASSEEPSAHMTTIWMGESSGITDPDAIVEEVKLLASEFAPFEASVNRRGELGDDGADAIFLDAPQEALDIREALLEDGTGVRAAYDAVDQYPEWTPHVTLGYADAPAKEDYPVEDGQTVKFDRIAVWLADRYETFDLSGGEREPEEQGLVKAVFARGKLSTSEDPDTQASINRAKELLEEGAVGVSVSLDLHPDDVQIYADAEKKADADEWQNPIESYLPEGFAPRQRIRHTAIVGTPAFADARLTLLEDGVSVEGVVTFQGEWTGDIRNVDMIDLESSRTPSPILYNRDSEGHEGPTIGYLTEFEWVERPPSSHRPKIDDEAITASIKPLEMPARYFAQTVPTKAEPLRIGAKDKDGYRAIYGLAAPKGICHRSTGACFTWPGDPDPKHRHFHTGNLLGLDDGSDIRVGALTIGGAHLDAELAKRGVRASTAGNYRDDANRVFALVRAFETRYGLMISGIVPPDVSDAEVTRALACSPSVEFWPDDRGKRTLVGIHLVPRPAWPVMSSMGSADIVTTDVEIELEEQPEEELSTDPEVVEFDLSDQFDGLAGKIDSLSEQLAKIAQVTDAILALTPVGDIEIPE